MSLALGMRPHSTELHVHQKQRDAGHSTLSVLVGPVGIGIATWKRFAEEIERPFVRISSIDRDTIIRAWLESYRDERSLLNTVFHYLSKIKNEKPSVLKHSLTHKSDRDRFQFLETIAKNNPRRDLIDLCRIMSAVMDQPDERQINHVIQQWFSPTYYEWWTQMKTIHDLEPSRSPAILFTEPINENQHADRVSDFCTTITQLVESNPHNPIAWTVTESMYQRWIDSTPHSRAKAICQESSIRLRTCDIGSIRSQVKAQRPSDPSRYERSLEILVRDGASPDLAETFLDALKATSQPPTSDRDDDRARSKTERLLYEQLESMAETTGLFELNVRIPIPFGPHRSMEVDLISTRYRIAIEIDGFYHFNDQEAYRRDRRKDFELQKHGYFVLRFLPDEITMDLDVVLSRIRKVLSTRKDSAS